MEVDDIVFNGLASSLALLTNEQKELGSLVIDIGGGTTDYVVYANGIIKHTGVLAVGGDHVSNDLAYGLKVPLSRAEQLKIEHGSNFLDEATKGQTITISNDLGLPFKTVNLGHLRRIMSLRFEEIFQLVGQDLEQAGALDYLRAGVFLCGGGARIPKSPRWRSRCCRCPSPWAKPTRSADSSRPSTSRSLRPPSGWSSSARFSSANAPPNHSWPTASKAPSASSSGAVEPLSDLV